MKHRVVPFASLLGILLFGICAYATSIVTYTPLQVTERTDVWVHGRVFSVEALEEVETDEGTFVRLSINFEVLDTTESLVEPAITVNGHTYLGHEPKPGDEIFAALTKREGVYRPFRLIGGYGWYKPSDFASGLRSELNGAEPEVAWRFFRDARWTLDSGGSMPEKSKAYWREFLDSRNPAHRHMAIQFQEVLNVDLAPSADLWINFIRAYDEARQSASSFSELDYDEREELTGVLRHTVPAASAVDPNGTAENIMEFIEQDARELEVVQDDYIRELLLRSFSTVDDVDLIARLPKLYETYLGFDGGDLIYLPSVASDTLNSWLYELGTSPASRGVTNYDELYDIWKMSWRRGDRRLIPFLREVVSGGLDPLPGVEARYGGPAELARSILIMLEKSLLHREERLKSWVSHVTVSDQLLWAMLSNHVVRADRFLIEDLLAIKKENWPTENQFGNARSALSLIEKVGDPRLSHLVNEFGDEHAPMAYLMARASCGDVQSSLARAKEIVEAPLQDSRFENVQDAMYKKREALALAVKYGAQDFYDVFLQFTRASHLDENANEISRQAGYRLDFGQYLVADLRDMAVWGLVKSGHPDAQMEIERVYGESGVRGKAVAAAALYVLGSKTGAEYIEAYRNRALMDLPGMVGDEASQVISGQPFEEAIGYLNDPKLDDLYFERTKEHFGFSDESVLSDDPEFFHRNRARVAKLLITHIDDKNPDVRWRVVRILSTHKGGSFGPMGRTIEQQRAAIDRWKKYIAEEL